MTTRGVRKVGKQVDDAEVLKAYRGAKTAQEMVASWLTKTGMTMNEAVKEVKTKGTPFDVYVDKAPHMIKLFTQDGMIQEMERHVLDRKVKEFIMIAVCADMGSTGGVAFHISAAMALGATEAEIMEVLFLTHYEQAKNQMALIGPSVSEGFKMGAQAKKILGIE